MNYRDIPRRWLICCVSLWLCALTLPARAATLDTTVTVNIAAQPLESALLQLAEQASFQLVLNPTTVKARRVPALAGKMSIRQALDRLLRNTGLAYRWSGDHTVTIAPRSGFTAATAPGPPRGGNGTVPQDSSTDAGMTAYDPGSSSAGGGIC